ncbi:MULTISPECIES: hypothetical protein [unclassified Thioalkalivibrio]|uniref:hypothetical protein n=1 Tax=unclassified Thioalkalivibrio TaxID=2621013 RepID=UPI001E3D7742|nr:MULTISPECIES: hypothetical protein [unclassified Thioalkalivibrio]
MSWREVLGVAEAAPSKPEPPEQNPQYPQKGGSTGGFVDCVDIVRGGSDSIPAPVDAASIITEAARSAGLLPETLRRMLNDADLADLADGTLPPEAVTAHARSVADRWRAGRVLDDETELAAAERVRHDPLVDLPLLREDRMFIERCVVGRSDRHDLLTEYRRQWLAAADAEGSEIRRDNAARRAANASLRKATGR